MRTFYYVRYKDDVDKRLFRIVKDFDRKVVTIECIKYRLVLV